MRNDDMMADTVIAPAWWFAEDDAEGLGDFRWRPSLREQGFVFNLDVWFPSRKMCEDYIQRVLLAAQFDGYGT